MKDTESVKKKLSEIAPIIKSRPPGKKATRAIIDEALASELSNLLFSRAPVTFIESCSAASLADIVEHSNGAISEVIEGKPSLVTVETSPTSSQFFVALGDRPFVVDSILGCLQRFDISIEAFLHPIVTTAGGRRISLNYIKTTPLPKEICNQLAEALQSVAADLILATDEYPAMMIQLEALSKVIESRGAGSEAAAFLHWLKADNFIFLGYSRFNSEKDFAADQQYGVFKASSSHAETLAKEVRDAAVATTESLEFCKLHAESMVHSTSRLNCITVGEPTADGQIKFVHAFVGLYTSEGESEQAHKIPILRTKLKAILDRENALPNSYDYKNIVDIVDSTPRDEALRLSTEELHEDVTKLLSVQSLNSRVVSVREDVTKQTANIMLALPRERVSNSLKSRLQRHVEAAFGAQNGAAETRVVVSNKPLARIYFSIPETKTTLAKLDIKKIISDLINLSQTWHDSLLTALSQDAQLRATTHIGLTYADAFQSEYVASQSIGETLEDIRQLEQLSAAAPVTARISSAGNELSIYSLGHELTLSRLLPILENFGFNVVAEDAFTITPRGRGEITLHRFQVTLKNGRSLNTTNFDTHIRSGLVATINGTNDDDIINSLMITGELSSEAVHFLRGLYRYLWQITGFASRSVIQNALASVPTVSKQLWDIFQLKFDPSLKYSIEDRKTKLEIMHAALISSLREVTNMTTDRILRLASNVLENALRTNFFLNPQAVAIKISPRGIHAMPRPKPHFEIFVFSPTVEGVHLRSGKVARGGIRWSDRAEDYRSEVLGLMKTQRIKNVVIVPTGAKGGFLVRKAPKNPSELPAAGLEAYKEYVRALLSITDNLVDGQEKRPAGVIAYDDFDPYLVVAADKGTATFSDTANKIAVEEFKFWLGDAFASGGSKGYDHKLYAITAMGAFECSKRHFRDLGIDYEKNDFSVIGIGDMSGDVFGNGLLLSNRMKLLAAFNHKHIFIDPTPNAATSFAERKRLFEKPRSQWSDYDAKLISKGGGVFERLSKEITLSSEARTALSIPDTVAATLSGEELIHQILKARCDLLWNGGIGTYVKAKSESHADVLDSSNDAVRVDASDLRARVVAEGGNLGFTQRARVEFANSGGWLNSDAIDNSGGVDLSDHEVNLKLLFSKMIAAGKITVAERDKLLKEFAPEVCEMVLDHNRAHALLLSLTRSRSAKRLSYFKKLIRDLTINGYLDRNLDALPDDETLDNRAGRGQGITRPELAVLTAGVKLWLKEQLIGSSLLKEDILQHMLFDYFPKTVVERFSADIKEHPLKDDIIINQLVSTVVDKMGVTFITRMMTLHNVTPITVIRCFVAAANIIGSAQIRAELVKHDTLADYKMFISAWQELNRAIADVTSWLIRTHGEKQSLNDLVNAYQHSFGVISSSFESLAPETIAVEYKKRFGGYKASGMNDTTARQLSAFGSALGVLELIWTANNNKNAKLEGVATAYSSLLASTRMDELLQAADKIEPRDKWETELLDRSLNDIRRALSMLTTELLKKSTGSGNKTDVAVALPALGQLKHSVADALSRDPSVAAIAIIATEFRGM